MPDDENVVYPSAGDPNALGVEIFRPRHEQNFGFIHFGEDNMLTVSFSFQSTRSTQVPKTFDFLWFSYME